MIVQNSITIISAPVMTAPWTAVPKELTLPPGTSAIEIATANTCQWDHGATQLVPRDLMKCGKLLTGGPLRQQLLFHHSMDGLNSNNMVIAMIPANFITIIKLMVTLAPWTALPNTLTLLLGTSPMVVATANGCLWETGAIQLVPRHLMNSGTPWIGGLLLLLLLLQPSMDGLLSSNMVTATTTVNGLTIISIVVTIASWTAQLKDLTWPPGHTVELATARATPWETGVIILDL